jgi:predicted membrane protein
VFAIFTAIVAILNYQIDNLMYNASVVPKNFILFSIAASMMPYLIAAVLSFVVAIVVSTAAKSSDKKEPEKLPETQTLLEEAKS